MNRVVFAITVLTSAIFNPSAEGAPSPAAEKPSDGQEYLDAHNKARAEVGVGALRWNHELASATSLVARVQRDTQNCQFAPLSRGKYGANQMLATGGPVTPWEVVQYWIKDRYYYYRENNTCAPGRECGPYTQMVWKNSVDLGCAQASCAKDQSTLTICFYNPPGNVIGENPFGH